jgi:DNA-binding NarL/FixJ family response regulator
MKPEIKVLIADDHPIFRAGLRQVIESDPQITVVAEAQDGQTALELLAHCNATVAVLDVDMPHHDGFAVTRAIREQGMAVAVIFLTMHKDERFLNAALDLGVKGYLIKESATGDVALCIKTVAGGGEYVSPQLTGFLLNRSRRAAALNQTRPGIASLTPTERRILQMVAEYKTSREIANLLCLSVRTIEFHRAKISEKLALRGTHALTKFAVEHRSEL